MSALIQRLQAACETHAGRIALTSEDQTITYRSLWRRVIALSAWLRGRGYTRVALYRDNSIEWVVIDLACLMANVTLVPVPTFFSDAQIRYLLAQAEVELLFIDNYARAAKLGLRTDEHTPLPEDTWAVTLTAPRKAPASAAGRPVKITFTSGTTAEPRGVCLSAQAIGTVAASLCEVLAGTAARTHLSLLPLSTLLENVAGVYVPLLTGKNIVLYKGETLGLAGSSGINVATWTRQLENIAPDSMILIPQMLQALVAAARGKKLKLEPKFIAVGGGKVSAALLAEARALGLPVYEGYGLSECGSVVSLNTPERDRPGSVGMPLPHARVRIDGGRIMINTGFGTHYMTDAAPGSESESGWMDSGDLGYIDADGFLYVTGRAKNVLISSYGRNISPEWLESELLQAAGFAQCIVFGDAQPFCTAVIVPQAGHGDPFHIQQNLDRINKDLPDYARIKRWLLAEEAFTPRNGQLTPNGRPRRDLIAQRYRRQLNDIYSNQPQTER